MKRVLFILLLIQFVPKTHAQFNNKPSSSIGLSLNGGVLCLFLGPNLNLINNYTIPMPGGFVGGEFTYELRYKYFLLHCGIGVDFSIGWNKFHAPDQSRKIEEYSTMQYHYRFNDFKERTSFWLGYISILLGAEYNNFYCLVGTRIGTIPIDPTVQSFVNAHIWGTDDDVINPLEGLYTHDMGDFSYVSTKSKADFNTIDVMASFEIGTSFWRKMSTSWHKVSNLVHYPNLHRREKSVEYFNYKFAFFIDYGLSNMLNFKANGIPYYTEAGIEPIGGLIDIPEVSRIEPNSLYGYAPHRDAVLNNLYTGLKFTFLFQTQSYKHTKRCNCIHYNKKHIKRKHISSNTR